MATLSASNVTKTSVTLTCSGAGSPSNTRYWVFTCGGESKTVSNTSTSASCTFTGLTPGVTYSATCRYGPASNKEQYSGGSTSFTTDSPQTIPSGTANLSLSSKTPNSLTIKVSGMGSISATRTFYWYRNGSRVSIETGVAGSTTTDTYTFKNLSANTSYLIRFEYKRTGDEYDTYYVEKSFTTNPDYTHSLSLSTSATYNSISATVKLQAAVSYDVDCTVTLDGGRDLDATIYAGQTSRTRTWTSDITAATKYTIGLKDNLKDETQSKVRRTKNNFKWSTNISKGATFDLKYSDWNDFTSQLSDKAAYYGVTYNPATISKGDTLTAEKFNNIVATINKLVNGGYGDCVTTMSSVKTGDPVTADLINGIKNCLNE